MGTCTLISIDDDRKDSKVNISWQQIESDLHLIYKMCEGFNLRNFDQIMRQNQKFGNLFECSLKANICSKHPHPKILLTYFDVIFRFNVFFESQPEYISNILQLFVMSIQSKNQTLRAHATYILQKYMDKLIQSLGSCLKMYIETKRNLLDCNNASFDS